MPRINYIYCIYRYSAKQIKRHTASRGILTTLFKLLAFGKLAPKQYDTSGVGRHNADIDKDGYMTLRELLLDRDQMLPLMAGVIFYCVLHIIRLNGFMNAQGQFPSWQEYHRYQGGEFSCGLPNDDHLQ